MVQYVTKALSIAVFRLASRNPRPPAVYLHTESQAATQHTSQARRPSPSSNKPSHWLSHKLQSILPCPEFSVAARPVHEALGFAKYGFPIICCIRSIANEEQSRSFGRREASSQFWTSHSSCLSPSQESSPSTSQKSFSSQPSLWPRRYAFHGHSLRYHYLRMEYHVLTGNCGRMSRHR